jgi:Skp family chaperone for outer membrane proteins
VEETMKKCCVALLLLASSSAFAAESDHARFIDFTGTVIDGHVQRPTTLWMESRHRAVFDKLLSLKKSMRETLQATVADPTLR